MRRTSARAAVGEGARFQAPLCTRRRRTAFPEGVQRLDRDDLVALCQENVVSLCKHVPAEPGGPA